MKTLDYGNKSGFKVIDNNVVLNDNNSSEFLSYGDVASARTLNRPARNLYENQEEIYNLIQSLLKSVYGNFIGIVPNIYEGFSKDRFKYSEMAGNKFLRLPTGILYLRKDIQNDHSYYIPGEEQYQDDITPDLLIEDKNYSVVNQPNVNMFERQLAELIGLDLNDQANDIKVNCEFVDNVPHYSIKITVNTSDEENPQKVVELPKLFFNSSTGLVEERNILFRDNAIDIFNDFLEFYEDEITLPDSQVYKLNCLEPLIPVDSSFEEGMTYYLYYKVKGKENNPSSLTDLSKKYFLSLEASREDAIKLFSFKYANNEDVYDEVTPEGTENPVEEGWYELVNDTYVLSEDTTVDSEKTYYSKSTFTGLRINPLIDTLDQRLIATKRAELDTLLVRRRSNINGDVLMENGDINISIENNEIDIKDGDTNINITEEKISSTSENIENKTDNFTLDGAAIKLKDTQGLKVTRTNEEEEEEDLLSVEIDENKEVKIKHKGEDLLEVRDNEIDNEITTHKTIAPSEDLTYELGTETRRFLKVHGDLDGVADVASTIYNKDGNVIMSGLDLDETRKINHDIGKQYISKNSIVYHFDTDFKDNYGNDDLILDGERELTVNYDEEIKKFDNPIYPYKPYEREGKYAEGEFSLIKTFVSSNDTFTVDFWYRYNNTFSELLKLKFGNETFTLNNITPEIDFYTNVDDSLSPTIPFYKPSEDEYLSNYLTGDGYVEPGYFDNDFYVLVDGVIQPIEFVKKVLENQVLGAVYNLEKTVLKDSNGNPIPVALNDWMHVGIAVGSGSLNLYVNNYQYSFSSSTNFTDVILSMNILAIDELMIDNSAKETFAKFIDFNEGNKLNWAALNYDDKNLVLDISNVENVHANILDGTLKFCTNSESEDKTINTQFFQDGNCFKVVFINGHKKTKNSSHLTLNGIPIMVNKYGNLIPIPNHNITGNIYETLQPNTTLEMYYTSNCNGSPAFVVLGNPVVLSSADYTIYADGKVGDDLIGTIKPYYNDSNPYGWLICDGGDGSGTSTGNQTFDTTKYAELYTFLGTNKVPDLRECNLVGIGTNRSFTIGNHDIYSLGQFQDDQFQGHEHNYEYTPDASKSDDWSNGHKDVDSSYTRTTSAIVSKSEEYGIPRYGTTTHGKQVGVNYLIKAL